MMEGRLRSRSRLRDFPAGSPHREVIGVSAFFAKKSTDTNNGAIKLERVEFPGAKVKAPRILESHGTAPAQYPDWEG